MSPCAASWAGSCPPCLQCLPSLLPHSPALCQELGRGLQLGPGERRRQTCEREARGPRLSLSLAPPTLFLGQASGEQTPGRWETGTLRDQEVFSGQGGSRTTIQQCYVVLTLCRPLWPSLCACRKYLRDADRQVLAQRAFILTVKVLEDTLSELAEVRSPPPPSSPRGCPQSHHSHTSALRQIPLSPPVKHSFLPPHCGRSAAVRTVT